MATAPAKYVIFDMNANGDSKAGMREKRKHHIANVLKSESPLVVFLQEFLWKGIHSKPWEEFGIPDHFQYEGHNEAGFIFDTREITYLRIDNKTSVRNMYDTMVKESDMGSDYFELPRLCVYKIESKGAPNFEILCASWHGPYKVSMEKKQKALDTLVKFLLKLKVEEENIPLLLGGDFNMSASAVKNRLPSNDSLMLNTPGDSSIDMFIVSSDIMQLFSVSKVDTMKSNEAFDHLHLKIYLIPKEQTGDERPQRPPEAERGNKVAQGPREDQTGDEGPQGPPEAERGDEGPHGPREDQTGDEGPQGCEQTLPPTKKKASPSEDESKQKTKGQEGMSPEKQTEDEGPQGAHEEETGDERPQGPTTEDTGDEGPQGLLPKL
ncbi:uncharacterized protein LOC124257146 isoform X2 [Haliotis rubra]|uniref:uncharacterized protein LOC124257146 isoform X2 n=1 Tax=Haliotis rubra TaxID=36100 RepID=UPI001EE579D3|nr:uncharacterized protein LOC124257146 isoform X2 [Haliotis rubra]